ncbi:heterotrimeric G-protein alpha subunit, GPA3-like protein [Mycena vulgaris]|nr:heterotrimeric G-protein alpha subunit, GPA3-like protein [Mycena vulgaris]
MGAYSLQSDRASKARSDEIDRQLDEDSKRYKKEAKVLLLGSGESDKSTIVKQMKISHGGFSPAELLAFRPTIHKNAVDSAQAVVQALMALGLEGQLAESHHHLPAAILGAKPEETLTREMADTIEVLWRDPVIARVLDEHGSEFYLMDSATYFINDIQRLAQPGYTPTEEDVLRAGPQSTGITETRFNMGGLSLCIFDVGGQRSERKKWIHCFGSVTSIIFCTALSEYDQVLEEEKSQSLVLFESVINSRWFLRPSIILLLSKIDVFPSSSISPSILAGRDINKAARYVLWLFMQQNRARLSVYPHLVQATDTKTIRLMFAAVKETILQNALKDSGIL